MFEIIVLLIMATLILALAALFVTQIKKLFGYAKGNKAGVVMSYAKLSGTMKHVYGLPFASGFLIDIFYDNIQ